MLKIKNIKWDTDGDKEVFASLPQEVEFDETTLNLECEPDEEGYEDELLDAVSDWLTDEYGFCHGGFEVEHDNEINRIFGYIEPILAKAGYRIMDGDHETLIIRNAEKDADYSIRIEQIAN